jgi:plastocyanin
MRALALVAASAAIGTHEVTMPGQAYAPGRIDALVGETVAWRNTDHTTHSVTADDGSFESGDLAPGASFSRTFAGPGTHRFHCRIHRFMRGVVVVSEIVLRGPETPVLAGSRATLEGVAPEGGTELTLELRGQSVAQTTAALDGRFAFRLVPEPGARYRARAGSTTSAELAIQVAPRVTLSGSPGVLRVTAAPALPGAWVRIEVYSRERFAWHRYRSARLGPDSTAVVKVEPRRRVLLRARALAIGGFADGVSRAVAVGTGGVAHPSGHHGH